MTTIEILIRAFADQHATIESVADSVGSLGEQLGGDYKVHLSDPTLGDVRVGIGESTSPNSEPDTVVVYPSSEAGRQLSKLIPFCSNWKQIPNNPKASPFLYVCAPQLNLPSPVRIVALLTGAIKTSDARVKSIVLQR